MGCVTLQILTLPNTIVWLIYSQVQAQSDLIMNNKRGGSQRVSTSEEPVAKKRKTEIPTATGLNLTMT